jgi:hypothetical protein
VSFIPLVILVKIWTVQVLFDLRGNFDFSVEMMYKWTTWSSAAELEEQQIEDIVYYELVAPFCLSLILQCFGVKDRMLSIFDKSVI